MENQEPNNEVESQAAGSPEKKESKNTLVILLGVALAIALAKKPIKQILL